MNVPDYSPQELVRLELLGYPNPEGLHPIETAWRDLARKLMVHVMAVESHLAYHEKHRHSSYAKRDCEQCGDNGVKYFNWPKPFTHESTRSES